MARVNDFSDGMTSVDHTATARAAAEPAPAERAAGAAAAAGAVRALRRVRASPLAATAWRCRPQRRAGAGGVATARGVAAGGRSGRRSRGGATATERGTTGGRVDGGGASGMGPVGPRGHHLMLEPLDAIEQHRHVVAGAWWVSCTSATSSSSRGSGAWRISTSISPSRSMARTMDAGTHALRERRTPRPRAAPAAARARAPSATGSSRAGGARCRR